MSIETLQLITLAIPTVFGLIGMVWGITATILNHKSVPMSEVHAFLNKSETEAAKTDNPVDDEVVKMAKTIVKVLSDLGLLVESAKLMHAIPEVTPEETPFVHPADEHRG